MTSEIWKPMRDLDLTRRHDCVVRCDCGGAVHAYWDEFETESGSLMRGWIAENGGVYGLNDFAEYVEIGPSLPIDRSDEALEADKNMREITSIIMTGTGVCVFDDDDDGDAVDAFEAFKGMERGTVH